ncbi:MobT family relaxase [Clostridium sp. DL-VIII]|uniref:MobT family relaxase n=1 Tax=Clostridium sp. DL-VIII TaxID=641107 RepID=UPI00055890A8|nr:MobT family relaxase [Clostridium sp. DL-VIII]
MEEFLLEESSWVKELKEKRNEYGISQNKLAVAAGITRQYLSDIETGKVSPSAELQLSISKALERFNPDSPLEMLFDYVRIRFPTLDVKHIVEDVLRLKLSYMLHEDYGFYSYSEHYCMGDIFILVSGEEEKGVLVELKGRGCRQFENYLLAQERSWYEFFMDALGEGGVMKRLDLAINDKLGILNIPNLTEKCRNEECVSVFRRFKNCRSGELVRKDEKECMGNTLYIGSLQSEVYFCIYEKDYEQYKKNNIPIEDAEVKNRFEIRLKNERAYYAIRDLMYYDNPESTAFKIINRYVRFVDKEDKKPRSDWKLNNEWAWFIGENRESMKLTTKPEPYSFRKTLNWISRQVAPTLKMAMKLDEINNTQFINEIITNAELKEKHEKILKQQAAIVKEVITKRLPVK